VAPQRERICDVTSGAPDGRASDLEERRSVWPACCPGEWLWVDSNGNHGKSIWSNRSSVFIDLYRSGVMGPVVASLCRFFPKSCLFGKKRPLTEKFSKFCYKRIHRLADSRLVCKFRENWPIGSRWNRALLTWQKQNFGSLSRSRFCADRAKICQGQRQTMYSECPKFHPNRFTSGGVIAERVNTVQTRHKVFPILGQASASSPSN